MPTRPRTPAASYFFAPNSDTSSGHEATHLLMVGGNFRKLSKVKAVLGAAGATGFWDIDERWLRDEDICTE